MESQLHRTPEPHSYESLHPAGTDVHDESQLGGETKSKMEKVKAKVGRLKDTIMHHGHKDEAETVNDSPPVRIGMVEPTVMGTPVLAEDLYATHSDIVDPPMRSFAQWEEEDRRGAPPPLPTEYGTDLSQVGHPGYGHDVKREQLRVDIGKPTGMKEKRQDAPPPLSTGVYGTQLTNQSKAGHPVYGQDVNREQLRGNIGKSTGVKEDESHDSPPPLSTGIYGTHMTDPLQVGHPGYGQDVKTEQSRSNIGKSTGVKEEERHGAAVAPPLSTGSYGTDQLTDMSQVGDGQDENREKMRGTLGKSRGMEEDPNAPNATTAANYQTKVTDPTNTGGKEAGITDVLKSFDKMKVFDEHESKSLNSDQHEPPMYTGSHNQFAPEPVGTPPQDTVASDPSNQSSALADKAAAAKDMIVSKMGENKSDTSTDKPEVKSSFASDYSHKVADTLSGTLGPVYEKVMDAGSSLKSKMGGLATEGEGEGVTVKEYLVNTFTPGDDDKELSEVITHAFHRGKGNEPPQETSTYVVTDEGERRLQDSAN